MPVVRGQYVGRQSPTVGVQIDRRMLTLARLVLLCGVFGAGTCLFGCAHSEAVRHEGVPAGRPIDWQRMNGLQGRAVALNPLVASKPRAIGAGFPLADDHRPGNTGSD